MAPQLEADMNLTSKSRGACPVCAHPVEMSGSVFRSDLQCGNCGELLRVSSLYLRTVAILGMLLGYSVAWKLGEGSFVIFFWGITFKFLLLCLPLAFLGLSLLVRIAPHVIHPMLVQRPSFESHFITMGLSAQSNSHPGAEGTHDD